MARPAGRTALARCCSVSDLRRLAQRRIPPAIFDFLEGGADDETTAARNVSAFDGYALTPRACIDVAEVDCSTTVLGAKLDMPLLLSPTGASRMYHSEGELAVARAAAAAGVPYSLATFSTATIEAVAAASGEGVRLFQLYPMRDRGLNAELMARCRAAGFTALCITIDCPVAGNRERDLRNGMATRPRRIAAGAALSAVLRPGWLMGFLANPHVVPANFSRQPRPDRAERARIGALVSAQLNPSITWDEAAWIIREWKGPVALKGVLDSEDALRAADAGATAVIVSNHGGRQLDGAAASVDALPAIAKAASDRIEIILDGGVRRGTHLLKAIALGAHACMIGRPYLYGLAAGGEAGVRRVLDILRAEIRRDMALMGCPRLADLDLSRVRRLGADG